MPSNDTFDDQLNDLDAWSASAFREGSVESLLRLQTTAALTLNSPTLMRACLDAIGLDQVDVDRSVRWAIEADAPVALEVLFEAFQLDPMGRCKDGEPFVSNVASQGSPQAWAFLQARGVPPNVRWEDAGATNPVFPAGPLNLVSMGIGSAIATEVEHRRRFKTSTPWTAPQRAMVEQWLKDPMVTGDQDLLDHALYVCLKAATSRSVVPSQTAWVQRLLDLGANPSTMFVGQPEQNTNDRNKAHTRTSVSYLTGNLAEDHAMLGHALSSSSMVNRLQKGELFAHRSAPYDSMAHHLVKQLSMEPNPTPKAAPSTTWAYWSLIADKVDWSTLPPDVFGRTPLALAMSNNFLRLGSQGANNTDDWHGRLIMNELFDRGASLEAAAPGWDPLRLAWSAGAQSKKGDEWGPFWALCNHHRTTSSPLRMDLATTQALFTDWSDLWGRHLFKEWNDLLADARQARIIYQTARGRALVQWSCEEHREVLNTFVSDVRRDVEALPIPQPFDHAAKDRATEAMERLPEVWSLRLTLLLSVPQEVTPARARPRL